MIDKAHEDGVAAVWRKISVRYGAVDDDDVTVTGCDRLQMRELRGIKFVRVDLSRWADTLCSIESQLTGACSDFGDGAARVPVQQRSQLIRILLVHILRKAAGADGDGDEEKKGTAQHKARIPGRKPG